MGSLGYLVNTTRPDLAFAYSELSKYVDSAGLPHMHAAEHALRYLRTFDKSFQISRLKSLCSLISLSTFVEIPLYLTLFGDGWIRSGLADIDSSLTRCVTSSC